MERWFLPDNIGLMEKMLDYASLRHRVIANNIANVNTPGFKRSDVSFDKALAEVLEREGVSGVGNLTVEVIRPRSTVMRNDGNNVDIDREMANLTQNSGLYNIYAKLLTSQFRLLRMAIKGG